ncbi:MAG: hypothetical protein ACLFU8_07335 [Anaerolineales bacterium]
MSGPLQDRDLRSPHPFDRWHIYQGRSNDCGPACIAIVANTLRGASVTGVDVLSQALVEARPLPGRVRRWATFPWGMARAFRDLGFHARWRVGVSAGRLRKNLLAGRATVLLVGRPLRVVQGRWRGWAHYKVLYSWAPHGEWGFVDPAVASPPVIHQPARALRTDWNWLGRQSVEVWA